MLRSRKRHQFHAQRLTFYANRRISGDENANLKVIEMGKVHKDFIKNAKRAKAVKPKKRHNGSRVTAQIAQASESKTTANAQAVNWPAKAVKITGENAICMPERANQSNVLKFDEKKVLPVSKSVVANSSAPKYAFTSDTDYTPSYRLAPQNAPIVDRVPEHAEKLFEMLSFKRPGDTDWEEAFIKRYIDVIPNILVDEFGNFELTIGDDPKVLFSCHTDTVHHEKSARVTREENGRQPIRYKDGLISLDIQKIKRNDLWSNCLGGDNGVGVWLMLEMIKHDIPGTYMFHRLEETGGLGSAYVRKNFPSMLKTFHHAIAFDRRGTKDIITHQGSQRTCSDAFAKALGQELSYAGNDYAPSDGGVFTDTKNYCDIISECTNVSCGYYAEHGPTEVVDLHHVLRLREKLLEMDFSKLPIDRDPSKKESKYAKSYYYGAYGGWDYDGEYNYSKSKSDKKNGDSDKDDSDRYNKYWEKKAGAYQPWKAVEQPTVPSKAFDFTKEDDDACYAGDEIEDSEEVNEDQEIEAMIENIRDYPDVVAEILYEYGITATDLKESIYEKTGEIPVDRVPY